MKIDALIAKLETQKQQLAKVTLQLAKMYVRKTGKTLDEIINLMKQQTWLTADEAKGWGFVDEYSFPRQLQENGAFYQDAGQNKKRILSMLSQGRQITNLAIPIKTDDTIFRLANAVLTGELAMKPGKKLFKMYITDDTGEFMIEPVGELDGKSFVTHLTVFHPGLKDTLFGFINAAKNDNLVFVVQDSDGQKYLMGDKLRPAVYAGSPDVFGTGKETAARKGISMEFTYKTANLYIYPGNIPLPEALPG